MEEIHKGTGAGAAFAEKTIPWMRFLQVLTLWTYFPCMYVCLKCLQCRNFVEIVFEHFGPSVTDIFQNYCPQPIESSYQLFTKWYWTKHLARYWYFPRYHCFYNVISKHYEIPAKIAKHYALIMILIYEKYSATCLFQDLREQYMWVEIPKSKFGLVRKSNWFLETFSCQHLSQTNEPHDC